MKKAKLTKKCEENREEVIRMKMIAVIRGTNKEMLG